MTYQELHTRISNSVLDSSMKFLLSTPDHINQHRGEFPLAVLDPPTANFPAGPFPFSSEYTVQLAFMDQISPDSDWQVKYFAVRDMDAKAREFIQRLDLANQVDEISNIQIIPFHTFTLSAHHTAGVLLSFDYLAQDSFDYCTVEATEAATESGGFPYEFPYNLE